MQFRDSRLISENMGHRPLSPIVGDHFCSTQHRRGPFAHLLVFLGLCRLGESFVRQGRGAQAGCTLLTPESLLNADQNAQVERPNSHFESFGFRPRDKSHTSG
jgi:hypothetical protein